MTAHAGGAFAAGVAVDGAFAVDGLGQDLGAGGLAGAPGAGEEVSVGGSAFCHLLLQRFGDVTLTDDIGKGFGPPFAVKRLVHKPPPS